MVPPFVPEGQGFALDLPGVEAAITGWTELLDELRKDNARLSALYAVTGPGDEFSSEELAHKANSALAAFQRHVASMSEFANNYVTRLTDARDEYLAEDDGVTGAFRRQGAS